MTQRTDKNLEVGDSSAGDAVYPGMMWSEHAVVSFHIYKTSLRDEIASAEWKWCFRTAREQTANFALTGEGSRRNRAECSG
ncbi:hypothetical protein BGS_0395 [Beggiatoa sp. SS]|nr:hypothetical protein BGS_0395 [Beggiatoa sp. SS]